MFKKLLTCVACAAMAFSLVGCSKSSKYAKVGFGTVISEPKLNEDGTLKQSNTTMATVGLDKDGKIAYLDLDVAQIPNPNDDTQSKTKKELKEDYGMKKASTIEKEWYEQIQALEEYAIGKTPEEFAAIETEEKPGHPEAVKTGTDLATGCTMDIGGFKQAVAKAVANAVEVEAEKIGAGEDIAVNAKGQVNNNIGVVALDADGKIVWAYLDTAQTLHGHGDETKTKKELKEDYAMKKASSLGKELYEHLEFLEGYLVGKTLDDVKAIQLDEKGYTQDADITAGCTVRVSPFQSALIEAIENAK